MRALIVEDERELAGMIATALNRAGFAADAVHDLAHADTAMRTGRFDVMILDLGLPDGDGLTFLKSIRRRDPHLPILIVTARDAVADRVTGLNAGADDYLLKPFHTDELIARSKALLRRPGYGLGTVLSEGDLTLDTAAHVAAVAGRPLRLSRREFALFELLVRRHGRVVSKEQIESSLYGFDDDVGNNAIEVLVHRLRRHLKDAGTTATIHTLRGVGYMLAGEAHDD